MNTLASNRQYVAIDITPNEMRVISVRRNVVEKWSSVPLREGLIRDGIIVSPQDLSLALETMFTSLDLPRNRVVCTITGLPFSYRTIVMPDSNGAITQEAIERAARKEMSINERDMFIFWKAIERHPENNETSCFVTAVPKIAIRPLVEALEKANIDLYELDIKPLALARLAAADNAVIISMEKKYIDVVIVTTGSIKTMYSLPLLKNTGERDDLAIAVANGLDKTVNSYNREYPGSPLTTEYPIMVSGELANDPALLKKLSELSGHTVAPFESPVTLPEGLSPATYAANLGLVLKKTPLSGKTGVARAAQYKDVNINLLASFVKKGMKINVFQIVGVGIAVLMLVLIFYTYNLRQDAMLKLNTVNSEKEATTVKLLVLQKTDKDNLAAQEAGAAQIQQLKGEYEAATADDQFISKGRIDCAREFNLVISSLPANAKYDTIQVDKKGIETSGRASEARDVLRMSETLEADSGISESRVAAIIPSTDPETSGVYFNLAVIRK